MSGPVLVAVYEDATALRDVERELCDRYARHYRILCTGSPQEACAHLDDLAAGGDEVALILAGHQLSGMTGSELSEYARRLHPHAKRGLLIPWGSWGDRALGEAIFDSVAHGRIDHHVLLPSGSPDELFHQAGRRRSTRFRETRGDCSRRGLGRDSATPPVVRRRPPASAWPSEGASGGRSLGSVGVQRGV